MQARVKNKSGMMVVKTNVATHETKFLYVEKKE